MDGIGRRYHGRVQGVGFRATARSIASRLGLDGWVRNEPDGSVTLVASGTTALLETLEQDIHHRLGAGVTSIERFDPTPEQSPQAGAGFEVRR